MVLPAFNESAVIAQVINSLPEKYKNTNLNYIVINDGSTDNTASIAVKCGIETLNHIINRGLGASIKTGMEVARTRNFDVMVTYDSDGQHNPDDLLKVIDAIVKTNADLVIGSRFLIKQKAPLDRRIINKLANLLTFGMYGVYSTDSQSGLRAFSKRALGLIDFKGDRMDFSSEILLEAKKNNLKIVEVPIKMIYTGYSRNKGQTNLNSFSIFIKFLVRLLR